MTLPRVLLLSLAISGAGLGGLLTSCAEEEKKKNLAERKSTKAAAPAQGKLHSKRVPLDKPMAGVDDEIEAFTGAHTRVVWTEFQRINDADTFADGEELLLKGLDSRDGRGERMIQDRLDNYARPMLSTNGESIIFSNKKVEGPKGQRRFISHVYRTDWKGSKPVKLTEGYATDCWADPATGVEWIYVARGFRGGKRPSLDADRIVRVQLHHPKVEEPVYTDGRISPDNLQLSRDGSRASGVFPWPNCGILLKREDGTYDAQKLLTGCWPSMAPDDSGVSWVFDGAHRGAIFFTRDRSRMWQVNFNHGAGMDGYELYHPRWSNHPRFMTITGPYVAGKSPKGNMIREGGASAQVHIGRFSEDLGRVEAWLQVTHDTLSESYPDVWIAGGHEVSIPHFQPAPGSDAQGKSVAETWPAVRDSLVFLWQDRGATNHFRGADGRMHDTAELVAHGTARFGRHQEMLVSADGWFESEADLASYAMDTMKARPDISIEMVLLPDAGVPATTNTPDNHVFQAPGIMLGVDEAHHLTCTMVAGLFRSENPLPREAVHLVVMRKVGGCEAFANGVELKMVRTDPPAGSTYPEGLKFGGGWAGGLLGVAIHGRILSAAEMNQHAGLQREQMKRMQTNPPRILTRAKLVEASAMPTVEGITPYRGAMVAYVYEVESTAQGSLSAGTRILVKHWAMLDQRPVIGFPRPVGQSYDLMLESESHHLHLKGERVDDESTLFDAEVWIDVAPPRL